MQSEGRGRLIAALVIAMAAHGTFAVLQLSAPLPLVPPGKPASIVLEVSFVRGPPTARGDIPEPSAPEHPREEPPETTRATATISAPGEAPTVPLQQRREGAEKIQKISVEKQTEDALPLQPPITTVSSGLPDAGAVPAAKPVEGLVVPALPRYRENPPPTYPPAALRRGYEGVVVLSVTVETDGGAGTVLLETSSGYHLLDRAALSAVRGWRFEPATRGGVPVEMTVTVPVRFELRKE